MRRSSKRLVYTALFAALIAVMTAFIKVYTGINEGYIHFGDTIVYLAACLLPWPYAPLAAAIGGGLADILAGAPIWAIPTALIKALNTLPFTAKQSRILTKRNALMCVVSGGLITVCGYYLAESILFSPAAALLSVPYSLVQAVGSAALFLAAGGALDKIKFKERFLGR